MLIHFYIQSLNGYMILCEKYIYFILKENTSKKLIIHISRNSTNVI